MVVEYEHTSEPQHDHDHDRTQELTHGMGQDLARQHAHEVRAIGRVHGVKTVVHLLLSDEGLDDAQASKCLLHLTHRVAP